LNFSPCERPRAIVWKQWKRGPTRFAELRRCGVGLQSEQDTLHSLFKKDVAKMERLLARQGATSEKRVRRPPPDWNLPRTHRSRAHSFSPCIEVIRPLRTQIGRGSLMQLLVALRSNTQHHQHPIIMPRLSLGFDLFRSAIQYWSGTRRKGHHAGDMCHEAISRCTGKKPRWPRRGDRASSRHRRHRL
jgi:hypothetical protein